MLEQQHASPGPCAFDGPPLPDRDPLFEDRRCRCTWTWRPDSWAAVEEELLAQDTLSRCGILLKPDVVVLELRGLAARGIKVRLPEALFRSVRLPAHSRAA